MVDNYLKIKDRKDIVKDPKSGAILSCDKQQMEEYLAKKRILSESRKSNDQVQDLSKKVDELSNDITEIKNLLKGLLK
jgi:uncharacterized coiled-coil DUF342 family protein